jgi:RNA polymerase sigma-70 factor (sigma-E family)
VTFEDYVVANLSRLARFAAVLTGDRTTAEDILQTVLARACAQWDRVNDADVPHAYVRRMIVNEHLSWQRRARRVFLAADLEDLLPAVDDGSEQHANRLALLERVQRLPPRQRAAIVLRYYEDLDDDEIATTLGTTTSTVRSNIARALATMRVETPSRPRTEAQ